MQNQGMMGATTNRVRARLLALTAGATTQASCAIHYYDPATGTEHLWGFGHMAMRVHQPVNEPSAVVTGIDTLGLSLGTTRDSTHLAVGWHSIRRIEMPDNGLLRLEWPSADFFAVRLGAAPGRQPWCGERHEPSE